MENNHFAEKQGKRGFPAKGSPCSGKTRIIGKARIAAALRPAGSRGNGGGGKEGPATQIGKLLDTVFGWGILPVEAFCAEKEIVLEMLEKIQKLWIDHLLWPCMAAVKKNETMKILDGLKDAEAAGEASLNSLQASRLSALLLHCKQHVPAYRSIMAADAEIREDPYRVLREQVRPLRKAAFRADAAKYLAGNLGAEGRIANCTGGSTGQPLQFYMDRHQVQSYEAARWRGLSWYGVTPGSRSVMIWGNPFDLSKSDSLRFSTKEKLLKNRCILSAYALKPEDAQRYAAFLNRYQPEYLYGYANALTAFAKILAPVKDRLKLRLKVVVSTSETLFGWQKELLRGTFSCPVANEYGARDAGILAYSCPCGKLHITAENALIEALDPVSLEPVQAGREGVLAVTDLCNRVQPRLRYLLGDYGSLSEGKCACGRPQPLLKSVEGREDALLVGPDGKLVHGNFINQILRPYAQIRRFQFRQHTPVLATLTLEADGLEEGVRERILSEISKVLPGVRTEIAVTDQLSVSASGKFRYSVREFEIQ